MADKNLNISNMNGDTDNSEKTCGITDMNCVETGKPEKKQTASLNNMNSMSDSDDRTCGITDMNCLNEK